jgi:nitroreductase
MCEPIHEVVHEVILHRRSVRSYDPQPIEDAVLAEILEAGRQAPSASNRQPWQFVVVREPQHRRELAEACSGQSWLADAGVLLVAFGLPQVSGKWYSVDVAIAMENIVIAAASHNLGTCWIGAFDEAAVKRVVSAPAEARAVAVTPIGVPLGEWPGRRTRKDFGQLFSAETFGQPLVLG